MSMTLSTNKQQGRNSSVQATAASSTFLAEFRRLSDLAESISRSGDWKEREPNASQIRHNAVLRRQEFKLSERDWSPTGAPFRTEFRIFSKSEEADLRTLVSLGEAEAEKFGLKIVAGSREELGRAEQWVESHIDVPTSKYRYSLL